MHTVFWILVILCSLRSVSSDSRPVEVMSFGAAGDGKTDDSKSFRDAWKAVCESSASNPTLQIPSGKTFLLSPVRFQGPCKSSSVHVQIEGKIVAPKPWEGDRDDSEEAWLEFADVDGLLVNGKGEIDGRGGAWWKSCPVIDNCMRPTELRFRSCSNLHVSGLRSTNSPRNHISITNCSYASFTGVTLVAPEESPNTDGFDISSSSNIQISDSYIGTGDDCIAINSGSSNVTITGIHCGPGHGISIGSLGKDGSYDVAENIRVKNCIFTETENGVRIKTWEGGSGYARNIIFEDIQLHNSKNPIVIDQFYCPRKTCQTQGKAVQVSYVTFARFHGTSGNSDAIELNCSSSVPCTNIQLSDIYIAAASPGEEVYAHCNNAHGSWSHTTPSTSCLLRY